MNFLYLTIFFPLVGFLILASSCGRFSDKLSAVIGIGSVGFSACITIFVGIDFFSKKTLLFNQLLWTWINLDTLNIQIGLRLNYLSLTMLSIVIGVGLCIHIYSAWYMRDEKGYSRFFAYTNFFIAFMLIFVLADNLLLMYLGWEGIGLCSYALIGFYYTEEKNCIAAIKAFITTRIGDVFLAFALFLLYKELGTLNLQDIIKLAPQHFAADNHILKWVTLMFLGGAVGKSAQLPLQTWLADAMSGPTPVSALIHAATMVTAGVYLIACTHDLFLMTPEILQLVGIIGGVTLILAACSALVQSDIKRILAYSTMSQIGYMFLALGVQAWNAAIFHLMTHAFFKALLFLSAGSVIIGCNHEQNIFKMGGLRKNMPLIYICFLVGGASLSALPLFTAGFFSKESIIVGAMVNNHLNLMIIGLVGAFITSLYTFRMIFITFHGKQQIFPQRGKGIIHDIPLIVLLILSTFVGGLLEPSLIDVFPVIQEPTRNHLLILRIVSSISAILGILVAVILWLNKKRNLVNTLAVSTESRLFLNLLFNGWGFDFIYQKIFVNSYLSIARLLSHDPLNIIMNFPISIVRLANNRLLNSVTGYLRWYVASMMIGAILVLFFLILI